MKEQIREEPKIVAAAEKKMQAWAHAEEMSGHAEHEMGQAKAATKVIEYVSLSRESGACGTEIADRVGEALGWEVLDKNLMDQVAERYNLSRSGLEVIDESPVNWAYDILGTWLDSQVISHDKYVAYLGRMLRVISRHQHVVYLGRGAHFFLPRERGLAVRIIAAEDFRIRQIMDRHGIEQSKARQLMRDTDHARRSFVKHFCRYDINDPHSYDLIVNSSELGVDHAAELIIMALRQRFPELEVVKPVAV